jgi:hypothetical protein
MEMATMTIDMNARAIASPYKLRPSAKPPCGTHHFSHHARIVSFKLCHHLAERFAVNFPQRMPAAQRMNGYERTRTTPCHSRGSKRESISPFARATIQRSGCPITALGHTCTHIRVVRCDGCGAVDFYAPRITLQCEASLWDAPPLPSRSNRTLPTLPPPCGTTRCESASTAAAATRIHRTAAG